jgi:hypothetical protein
MVSQAGEAQPPPTAVVARNVEAKVIMMEKDMEKGRWEEACREAVEVDTAEVGVPYESGEGTSGVWRYSYERYRRIPTTMALADQIPAKQMRQGELVAFIADQ